MLNIDFTLLTFVIHSTHNRVAGARTLTMPPNEPATNIDGENRQKLLDAIKKLENETLEVPVISGGEKVYTGKTNYQSIVSTEFSCC